MKMKKRKKKRDEKKKIPACGMKGKRRKGGVM